MKRTILGFLLLLILSSQTLYAAPERIVIKKKTDTAKQDTARAAIRNIDLDDIEDPAAKRAIGEIFNYLNLHSKK